MGRIKLMIAAIVCVLCTATAARATPTYLFATSGTENASLEGAVATAIGGGAAVVYWDVSASTPTASDLSAYAGVFTSSDSPYYSPGGFGDLLASYVDSGGRVVLGAFTTSTVGVSPLGGAIMGSGYSPVFASGGNGEGVYECPGCDGTGPLWFGVGAYWAGLRDDVTLQGAGIANGHFGDGTIAAAYRPDFGVIYLGGMGPEGWTAGDDARLLANAFLLPFPAPVSPVPEPGTLFLFGSGLIGLGGFARKKFASRHRATPEQSAFTTDASSTACAAKDLFDDRFKFQETGFASPRGSSLTE